MMVNDRVPWVEPETYDRMLRLFDGYQCPPEMRHDACEVFSGVYDVPGYSSGGKLRVIDVGANCGAYVRWVTDRWPEAEVTCYEPNPDAFSCLLRNVRHLRLKAECHPVAVRRAAATGAMLRMGIHNMGEASFHDLGCQRGEGDAVFVDAVAAAGLPDCDVLKIDTEGCEVEIIDAYLGSRVHHPDVISLEFHRARDRVRLDEVLRMGGWSLIRGVIRYDDLGTLNYVHQRVRRQFVDPSKGDQ